MIELAKYLITYEEQNTNSKFITGVYVHPHEALKALEEQAPKVLKEWVRETIELQEKENFIAVANMQGITMPAPETTVGFRSKWIAVMDQQPPIHEKILVKHEDVDGSVNCVYVEVMDGNNPSFTHWMRIPQ